MVGLPSPAQDHADLVARVDGERRIRERVVRVPDLHLTHHRSRTEVELDNTAVRVREVESAGCPFALACTPGEDDVAVPTLDAAGDGEAGKVPKLGQPVVSVGTLRAVGSVRPGGDLDCEGGVGVAAVRHREHFERGVVLVADPDRLRARLLDEVCAPGS